MKSQTFCKDLYAGLFVDSNHVMPVHVTIMHHMLTTLHERPDLLDDAARLLIQEWPRSLEAR